MAERTSESLSWRLGRLGRSATEGLGQLGQLGYSVSQVIQDQATRPCVSCGEAYIRAGMIECSECKQCCCRQCFVVLNLQGPAAPKRSLMVCRGCEPLLRKRCSDENVRCRMGRVEAFLADRLEPFTYDPESKLDQTLRLSGHVMHGLKQVTSFLPLGQAAQAVKAGYYLVRYGPLILAGNEIMEAFQLIVGLARKLETPSHKIISGDFFGGLYYTMGEQWGQRGCAPELERLEHAGADGQVPRPDRDLLLRLRHLLRLLQVAKEPTATDAQRLLRQAMPGAQLVSAELSSVSTRPSYFLVCSRETKTMYFIMPGTRNPADLATDFNATEEEFGAGSGHCGMVRSAQNLMEEVSPLLIRLYTEGYKLTIVGHSLGAGVGAFLTLMLKPHISSVFCYGYGTPACVDERLQPALLNCMVSVVNRDDMVPRLSVRSVQELVDSVLCPGQVAKTQAWMREDWQAVKDLERVVELRRRSEPQASMGEASAASGSQASAPDASGAAASDEEEAKILVLTEAGVEREVALRALRSEDGDLNRALLRATDEEVESPMVAFDSPAPGAPPAEEGAAASAGAVLGGLLQNLTGRVPWPAPGQASGVQLGPRPSQPAVPGPAGSSRTQHVHFLVPGQLVHIYKENGLSRAALAAASHESLARIVPCQNMLNDHKIEEYMLALHQVCIEEPRAPRWESFDERKVCACCCADFSWAYVLQSEAQKMLSRHNCFACGHVVCDGCSRKRLAHAELGFPTPVRTCDGCAFAQFEAAPILDALAAAPMDCDD
eukprot:TRINITY_DN32928_c0_g1_i1.p1 TRINITY_DN32928_c0_g1~~TRINITY_DN32928_c0_g1_i1.p1  ORF type:complete len:775 (-),score=171.19 TRINITY_DN32928_c0_g1_i1:301-2625(-)